MLSHIIMALTIPHYIMYNYEQKGLKFAQFWLCHPNKQLTSCTSYTFYTSTAVSSMILSNSFQPNPRGTLLDTDLDVVYYITICANNTSVLAMITTIMSSPWRIAVKTFIQRSLRTLTIHITQPYLSETSAERRTSNSLSILIRQTKLTAYYHCINCIPIGVTNCTPNVVKIDFQLTLVSTGSAD